MDGAMMGASGGFELGGGYVTIGGDLAPLREAIAEARSMTQGLVAQEFVLRPRLDLSEARSAMAEFRAEFMQLMGGGATGDAFGDIRRQLESLHGVNVAGPIGAMPGGATNPGSIGGGSVGYPRTGGARGLQGLFARGLGTSIAGLMAAEAAFRVTATYADASQIEAHPETFLAAASQFGGTFDPFSDSLSVGAAQGLASAQAAGERMRGLEGVPIFGAIASIADATARRQQNATSEGLRRVLSGEEYLNRQRLRSREEAADLTGDPVEAAQARFAAEEAPLAREAARTRAQIAREMYGAGPVQMTAGMTAAVNLQAQQAAAAGVELATMRAQHAQQIDYVRRVHEAQLGQQADAGYIGQLEAQAVVAEQSGSPGAAMRALQLRQQADYLKFAGEGAATFAAAKPEDQEAVRQRIAGQRQELEARQAQERTDLERKTQNELTSIQAQGEAARLRMSGDAFGAQMIQFEAGASARVENARASGQDWQAIQQATDAQRQELYQEQSRRGQDLIASSGMEIAALNRQAAASGLRMAGQGHAAAMLRFQDEDDAITNARRQAERLPPIQRGIALARLDARQRANDAARREAEFDYGREGALLGFQLDTGAAAAQAVIANQPLTARATSEAARIRVETRQMILAHPERRAQIIADEQQMLDAEAHEMLGFGSGGIARTYMSADEALLATGFGMDLGGAARDRAGARRAFQAGRGQIGVPIPGTEAPPEQALGDAAAKLLSAAGRLEKALVGVTIFTTGS